MNDDSKNQKHGSRLRDRQREQTQAAILEAAEAVLAEEGLDARIDAIAARAGVAVGTLYNHFGDRDGILRALVDAGRKAMLDALEAQLAAPSGDFANDLYRFIAVPTEHFRAHGAFIAAVMTERAHTATFVCNRREMLDEMQEKARRLIARGVALGQVRPHSDDQFIAFLIAVVRGAIVLAALDGRAPPDPRDLTELILHGISPCPQRPHAARSSTESP